MIVISDNGASGEGGPDGSVNENKFFNGIPDSMEENLALLDELGGTKTYNHYPNGWAMAFNTPFKMWKRYEFNGGTSDPCIISWPQGHAQRAVNCASSTTTRSISSRRSSTSPASQPPEVIGGHVQSRFDGVSMRYSFDPARAQRTRDAVLLDARLQGDLARRLESVTTHATISGWSNFAKDTWELYHTDVDRSELHNLAAGARKAGGAGQPVVRRGRCQRRVPAR